MVIINPFGDVQYFITLNKVVYRFDYGYDCVTDFDSTEFGGEI